jgi:dTDP-4-dehydrorhamnose 3,5-epimerase
MADITGFAIADLKLIRPRQLGDDRGFFSEVFRADWLPDTSFVQDNHSLSARRGTVRGLHFQKNPRAQGKLVRVVAGAILDVAVDIRQGSPTYGHHVAVELSADNWSQLWVPPGFLHGFCTLTDATQVVYKVTDYYSPEHDAAVAWNDPDIGIVWPVSAAEATLSAKDQAAPRLAEIGHPFQFEG